MLWKNDPDRKKAAGFWKNDPNRKAYGYLRYNTKKESVVFYCNGCNRDEPELAALLNGFLLALSKERKVFFHAYRLPESDEPRIMDPAVVLERAERLLDPFNTFFYLSEAKMQVDQFEWACEAAIYFFKNEVEWPGFLASSIIERPIKLIENEILSAHFTIFDHGAHYWFECNKMYEKEVLQLIESMSELGYDVQQSSRVSYPNSTGVR